MIEFIVGFLIGLLVGLVLLVWAVKIVNAGGVWK